MRGRRKPLGIVRCVVLDRNGRRCPRSSTTATTYHGEHELYDCFNGKPTWIVAVVCEKHAREIER